MSASCKRKLWHFSVKSEVPFFYERGTTNEKGSQKSTSMLLNTGNVSLQSSSHNHYQPGSSKKNNINHIKRKEKIFDSRADIPAESKKGKTVKGK